MGDQPDVMEWRGCEVIDRDGDKVGKLDEIYLDRETGQPEWAIVNTGLFGRKSSFVPIKKAMREGDMIRVAYQSDQIKDAPSVDPDGEVSQDEERQIYEHYGLEYSQARSGSGLPEGGAAAGTAAGTASGQAGGTASGEAGQGEPPSGQPAQPASAEAGQSGGATGVASSQPAAGASGQTAEQGLGGLRLQRFVREEIRIEDASDAADEGTTETVREERVVTRDEDN